MTNTYTDPRYFILSIIASIFFMGCTFDVSNYDMSEENFSGTDFKMITCESDATALQCEMVQLPGQAYGCDIELNSYMTPLKEGEGYVVLEGGADFYCPNGYFYDAFYTFAGFYTYDGETLVVEQRSGRKDTFDVVQREDGVQLSTRFFHLYSDHFFLSNFRMGFKEGHGISCHSSKGRKMGSCHAYYGCNDAVLLNCVTKMGCEAALRDYDVEGSWLSSGCVNLPKE